MVEGALTRRTAEWLIEAATAAPSPHNSQPWRFIARLADRVIDIYADPARTPRQGDPRGRAVHVACGSALFNLRLAIAQAGCEPVARLLPSPRDPLLLASVRLAGPYRRRPAERDLHAAIRRPAGRGRFTRRQASRGLLLALAEAAALEGASLRQPDQRDVLRMLHGCQGHHRLEGLPRAPGAGIPGEVPAVRDFSPGPGGRPRPPALGTASAQLAVICTGADDRANWLRAGQAMQRVLLLAAHRGLQAAALGLALEAPDVPPHGEPALGGGYPAMILRLGYGQQWPATARRPVAEVLRVVTPAGLGQRELISPPVSV